MIAGKLCNSPYQSTNVDVLLKEMGGIFVHRLLFDRPARDDDNDIFIKISTQLVSTCVIF